MTTEFGFIMMRHVVCPQTNKYWKECHRCIRRFYPDTPIVIVDDDSDVMFEVDIRQTESKMTHTTTIHSDFPKCGELLAYYYLYEKRLFRRAVIIHDSAFIQEKIDFTLLDKVKFLWHFTHEWDNEPREIELLNMTGYEDLDYFYGDFGAWVGCFGLMSVIELDFLDTIRGIFKLIPVIKTRVDRKCMERVFAIMCCFFHKPLMEEPSLLGKVHTYYKGWGYPYHAYLQDKHPEGVKMIKVWTGR